MLHIPHIELLWKHRAKILAGAIIFWLLLGALVYLTEWLSTTYFGAKFMDEIELKQYLLRWVVWFVLTPLIVLLGLRINIGNTRIGWFIVLHLLLGTSILALEFLIEWWVIKPVAELIYQRKVVLAEIILPFLTKYFGYILVYFLIIGIVNMFVYMKSLNNTRQSLLQTELQNNNLKYELALAQIQSLKMQIQPHFLFNTHQSVIGLIIQQENEKAVEMLTKLSALLRSTIEQQKDEFVPLREEMQVIGLYLDIQKVRFGERMSYRIDMDEQVKELPVPFFILQPLAENAVKYGVECADERVEIVILATVADMRLCLEVRNTRPPGSAVTTQGMGIGMKNVAQRLQQHYGDAATLSLETGDKMTVSRLILPAHGI